MNMAEFYLITNKSKIKFNHLQKRSGNGDYQKPNIHGYSCL